MTAGLLGMGLISNIAPAMAQPLYDRVHVNIPYTVNIGDKTLEPGEYTIQQNRDSGGGGRILLIYSDKGMHFETSAMTIAALDPDTPRHTELVLGKIGSEYYLNKMWIQGKDYGYELPMPSRLKSRQKEMSAVSVPAQYSTTSSTDTTVASSTTADQSKSTADTTATPVEQPVAEQPKLDATTSEQAQAATPATTPLNPPVTTDTNSADRIADQATTPTTPTTPVTTDSTSSADRSVTESTPATMPSTSAGWLMMMLGGGSLSGLGLALRRKRQ